MTSILAIRVPEDWATLEAITNLFSTYGNITLGKDNGKRFKFNQSFSSARVLRPGRAIPPDLRNYATQVPDIGDSLCAVVDFDGSDAALKAVRELKEKYNETGMRLALLGKTRFR